MPKNDSLNADSWQGSDWSALEPKAAVLEAPTAFSTLRQVLFPRVLPDAATLTELELISLLNEVELELMQKRYRVEFLDRLPPRAAYRGLCQLLDSPLPAPGPVEDGFDLVEIDGCDSACEACFQLAYCPVAREVLGRDWRKALEQAGSNPSWAALYAGDGGLTF
jgi:hypothetical protein